MMTRMIVISQVFCWLPKLLTHRSIWYDMILNSACVVSSALVLSERPLRAAPCQCLLVPPHSPRLPLRSCSTPPLRRRDAHKYLYCWIVLLNPDAARPILPACHLYDLMIILLMIIVMIRIIVMMVIMMTVIIMTIYMYSFTLCRRSPLDHDDHRCQSIYRGWRCLLLAVTWQIHTYPPTCKMLAFTPLHAKC